MKMSVIKNVFRFIFVLFLNPLFAEALNIGVLNGPSAVPVAYLMENKKSYKSGNLDFQIFSGADTELPKLLKGEIDIGILPPNAAAKVYNASNGNIICLAVCGEGNLSLLSCNKKYTSLQTLKGKKISCAGRGATPEYMFRNILQKNNFSESDIVLDFSIPNAELAGALISGKTELILVPEPFATVALEKGKEKGVFKITTLSDEYRKCEKTDTNFPMTLIVANKKALMTKKPEIEEYLKLFQNSVLWTNENPEKAGKLVEKWTLGLNAQIASLSIPESAFVYIPAKEAKPQIEKLLKLFLSKTPESIGGRLPDLSFYY